MPFPVRIGIMGWSAYRISGTGSVVRTLLQGLRNSSRVEFRVALPTHREIQFSNGSLNSVVVEGQSFTGWMKAAYERLASQSDVIFYPDSYALPHPSTEGSTSVPVVKGVTLLHDVLPLSLPEYYLNPFKYWAEKKKFSHIARYADHIITISHYSKKMISKKLGVAEKKIHLIYNGIDPHLTNKTLPKNNRRRGVLYVGDLRQRKNVMSLVKAYGFLSESIKKEHPLILAADGERKKIIKALLPDHPPSFRPRLTPEALKKDYLNAKVFVFPSLMEGFGLPVIEAQHCGLPVICGDHSGLKEITEDEHGLKNIYPVDVRQPKAIAQALTDLLTNPALYQDYQNRGFKNSLRFTSVKMVKQYQKFFEGLSLVMDDPPSKTDPF